MVGTLSSVLLLLCFAQIYAQSTDVSVCYPPGDLAWPDDAVAIQKGTKEVYDLANGKEPDWDSYKNIYLAGQAMAKIGVEAASEMAGIVPILGESFGAPGKAMVGIMDRLAPAHISTELECQRNTYQNLKGILQLVLGELTKIQNELDEIQNDVKYIIDLLNAQDSTQTYNNFRTELINDQEVLERYAKDPAYEEEAREACNSKPPFSTRASIRNMLNRPFFGASFIPALVARAKCNDTIYTVFEEMIKSDIHQLTALDIICSKLTNKPKESLELTYKAAGDDLAKITLALLVGRFNLQKGCLDITLEKDQNLQNPRRCNEYTPQAEIFIYSKYSLLKPHIVRGCQKAYGCEVNVYNANGQLVQMRVGKTDNCERVQGWLERSPITAQFWVPVDTNLAAMEYMKRQADNCQHKNSVCWPCSTGDIEKALDDKNGEGTGKQMCPSDK